MLTQSLILRMRRHGETGGALIAALIIIGILVTIAGMVLMTAVPAYRSTYHASAWHEAKLAADAGIDLGVAEIQRSIQENTNKHTWPGWKLANGNNVIPGTDEVRILIPSPALLVHEGDGSTQPKVVRVEVDVITRDDNPEARNPWYRVRSTGSAEIASPLLGLDKRDSFLRRISTGNQRVTRTVEVLVRPVYLWEYALKTAATMKLGGGTSWVIDSYDSRYQFNTTLISTDGLPPHRGSSWGNSTAPLGKYNGIYDAAKAGAFGNIASDLQRPATSPIGMLIDAEGARVEGEVHTHGGDDPNTVIYENVEESGRIDQTKIFSEFEENLLPAEDPLAPRPLGEKPKQALRMTNPWPIGTYQTNPATPPAFFTTSNSAGMTPDVPLRVRYAPANRRLATVPIPASPDGSPRYIEIYLDADLIPGSTGIIVPKNVHAKIFLNGNLDFGNRDINYLPAQPTTAGVPGNLQIFGISTVNPRVDSSGNGHIVAVFYGPQYTGALNGNTEILGSFVLKNYGIAGGGGSGGDSVGAGFHYDEALGVVGPIQAYKVVSYFEDHRRDVE